MVDTKDQQNENEVFQEETDDSVQTDAGEDAVNPDLNNSHEESDEQKLEKELESLRMEKEDYQQRMQRMQADFENFKRRNNEERARERKFRAQDIATELLPALDNFERALKIDTSSEDGQALKQGMEMVFRQMKEAMEKEGVTVIEALEQPFDPNLHQAVMQVDSDEHDSNIVLEVLQNGYILNGRVLRPAMVKVSS
jgi:molecular chaperone GrpE